MLKLNKKSLEKFENYCSITSKKFKTLSIGANDIMKFKIVKIAKITTNSTKIRENYSILFFYFN